MVDVFGTPMCKRGGSVDVPSAAPQARIPTMRSTIPVALPADLVTDLVSRI